MSNRRRGRRRKGKKADDFQDDGSTGGAADAVPHGSEHVQHAGSPHGMHGSPTKGGLAHDNHTRTNSQNSERGSNSGSITSNGIGVSTLPCVSGRRPADAVRRHAELGPAQHMQAPALAPGRGTGGRGASTAANAPSGAFGFQIGHGRVAPEPTAVASVSSGLLLRVGTWNCEHLALDMPSGPQHAKLLHMANAIVAANLEVVALQEVEWKKRGQAAVKLLVGLLEQCEAENAAVVDSDTPVQWRFIDHLHETPPQNDLPEMCAFIFRHKCSGRTITSATSQCVVLSRDERKKYVGSQKMFVRSPAYGRFFIQETSADAAVHAQRSAVYSVVLMSVHAKAPQDWVTQGTVRDLAQLGKLVKAIRITNADTLSGTPVVLMGDFNLDSAAPVYQRLYGKGWVPSLPPGIPTTVKGDHQLDNIWLQTGAECPPGAPSVDGSIAALRRSKAVDHGAVQLAEGAVVVPPVQGIPREELSDHCLVHCSIVLQHPTDVACAGWPSPGTAHGENIANGDTTVMGSRDELLRAPSYEQACESKLAALHRWLKVAAIATPAAVINGAASGAGCFSFPWRRGKVSLCHYVPAVESDMKT
mmetsp:Transcript_24058/g.71407  ORF Transcript_24058/g.71407 Transcript_24058/m.71407 type:complete len:588 (-) Transcript_24058:608-2371(-)